MGDIRGMAFGLLHLSRKDFFEMRLGEFWESMKAYRDDQESYRRHIGELVRGATLRLFNIQLKPNDRIREPSKFWRMPWDEDNDEAEEQEIKRLYSLKGDDLKAEIEKFKTRLENGKLRAET